MNPIMLEFIDVFVANGVPSYTYIQRAYSYETKLHEALERGRGSFGSIVSISGPSKSGKTVLCKTEIKKKVSFFNCAKSDSSEKFWHSVLSYLNIPYASSIISSEGSVQSGSVGASMSASVGFGGTKASLAANCSQTKSQNKSNNEVKNIDSDSKSVVFRYLKENEKILILDDFHYVENNVQKALSEDIKRLSESGVDVVLLSIPHRGDDAVRQNPDLNQRVVNIDIAYWSKEELLQIAKKGFNLLNMPVDQDVFNELATSAEGSPQLMQTLCLALCRELGKNGTWIEKCHMKRMYLRALEKSGITKSFKILIDGPKSRGTDRRIYDVKSFSEKMDTYQIIFEAASALVNVKNGYSITIREIMSHISTIVEGDAPITQQVSRALGKIMVISIDELKGYYFNWDSSFQTVTFPDPHFVFFMKKRHLIL